MENRKRSRLPTVGGVITSNEVIDHLKVIENEQKKKKTSLSKTSKKTTKAKLNKNTKKVKDDDAVIENDLNISNNSNPQLTADQWVLIKKILNDQIPHHTEGLNPLKEQ